jgi:predicted ATPase
MLLREVSRPSTFAETDAYPFSVPVVRALDRLAFEKPVTIFVGENGSGKSTLLEAAACAAHLPGIGLEHVDRDPTLAPARALAAALRWAWSGRKKRGFFLRAEDFFGYARLVARQTAELEADLREIDAELKDASPTAQAWARVPFRRELGDIRARYGDGLDAQSHGESFLKLFSARFVPDGLYLLDEPEAPLSPTRQLTLLAMMHEMVGRGSQFVIATHSPILMAYPGADLVSFDGGAIRRTDYASLESVALLRDFLNRPEIFLRHLLDE